MIKIIAKVSYELCSKIGKNITYKFNTNHTELRHGEFVIVGDDNKIGVFVGYEKVNDGFKPTENLIRRAHKGEIKEYWEKAENNILNGNFVITDKAYQQYINTFRGCKDLTVQEATKKIARNIILSSTFGKNRKIIKGKYVLYTYGTMLIYTKRNRVIKIEVGRKEGFKVNRYKYHYLNNVLGINK